LAGEEAQLLNQQHVRIVAAEAMLARDDMTKALM